MFCTSKSSLDSQKLKRDQSCGSFLKIIAFFSGMKLFVTVGTTKFQKLVNTISTKKVIETLLDLGYNFIQIQTGKYIAEVDLDTDFKDFAVDKDNESIIITLELDPKVTIKYDEYFENFEEQIRIADLVISHAGAGSCLDVLRQNKPLIVVINEDLMDNHQTELAKQLQKNGHLYYCTCETLTQVLSKDFSKLKPYPKLDQTLFSRSLDKYCGFID